MSRYYSVLVITFVVINGLHCTDFKLYLTCIGACGRYAIKSSNLSLSGGWVGGQNTK